MSNELHPVELLPAYALGCLDEQEAIEVTEHLAVCPACRDELAPSQAITAQLALAAPDAAPPAALKQQLLDRLQTPRAASAAASHSSWWQRIAGLLRGASPVWGIATLALVAVLVVSNLLWWQHGRQQEPLVTSGGMRVVAMVGTEVAPGAVGTLVTSEDGEYGTLVVDGLPALDPDHQYQLWLVRDEQRTSGGVFSVNQEGYGALPISSPEPLDSYPAFGITVEPAGGSPGPTGDKVLGGNL